MALRAFQNNPSIGGFGNESGGLIIQEVKGNREGSYATAHINSNNNDQGHRNTLGKSSKKKVVQKSSTTRTTFQKSNNQKSGGDAFAQILKELVDNAVDACSASSCGGSIYPHQKNVGKSKGKPSHNKSLNRVRVSIDKVVNSVDSNATTKSHNSHPFDDDNDNLLRVTVSDNGCGMIDIEKCVSAFSSSKAGGVVEPRMEHGVAPHSEGTNSKQHRLHDSNNKGNDIQTCSNMCNNNTKSNNNDHHYNSQSPTAGRYGIGLTLCLLHAQRLVPNSCTSITSSTMLQKSWTIAKFVVDAERDTVVCVDKKTKEKKKDLNESGTAVSLLVPGGLEAQKAWPRLAEYFARFQLSLGLQCSLQVMAPSLSTRPLFIRPICEIQKVHEDKNQQEVKEKEYPTVLSIDCCPEEGKICDKDEGLIGSSTSTSSENGEVNDDIEDWIYRNQQDELDKCSSNSREIRNGSEERSEEIKEEVDSNVDQDVLWLDNLDDDNNDVFERLKENGPCQLNKQKLNSQQNAPSSNKEQDYECRRKFLQSAVSSYLQQSIPLENIVSSCQKICIDGAATRYANKVCPCLEVDMIVCDDDDDSNLESVNSDEDDRSNHSLDTDPKDAKIFLIRMVNQIPLLDGAEASACGIVQGISRNRSMWNSFGLEVTPLNRSTSSCSQSTHATTSNTFMNDKYSSSYYLFMPTFSLRDSANVAPYFLQNRTHGLFEDDESSCSSDDDNYSETRRKRKKKKTNIPLLPAGLRLNRVLIIVQLEANPQELPLPTLSKGRLPMNDKAIDDALELGITSCLQRLQKSKPSLLLNSSQLKKTEREVKFIPSVATALASIVLNCDNSEQKKDMMNMMRAWQTSPQNYESPMLDKHSEIINSCKAINSELQESIASRFQEVMNLIEDRKVEQNKRVRAEYALKKKKARCDSKSDDSSCPSVADLDDFFSRENCASSTHTDDLHSDVSTNNDDEQESGGVLLDSKEDDFDDDDWW